MGGISGCRGGVSAHGTDDASDENDDDQDQQGGAKDFSETVCELFWMQGKEKRGRKKDCRID